MCFPKVKAPAPPEPLPERQAPRPPNEAAILQNTVNRTRRRMGYANLRYTPVEGLAPAALTGKTLLGQ